MKRLTEILRHNCSDQVLVYRCTLLQIFYETCWACAPIYKLVIFNFNPDGVVFAGYFGIIHQLRLAS